MTKLYDKECAEVVAKVIQETKGKTDIEVQRSLTAAFPFHRNNLAAWREFAKEIKKQSGRIMY